MNRIGIAASILFFVTPDLCAAQEEATLALAVPAANGDAVPAYVLEVPESVSDVLIADTKTGTLHRFGRFCYIPANEQNRHRSEYHLFCYA